MAWTAPRTWVSAELVTAVLMNTHVRDNFLETAPAKAATAGYFIRVTGANTIEEADPTDGAKLDGDQIDIDFTPSNYTPDATPAEASDVDDLAAHLKGIDNQIATTLADHIMLMPGSTSGTVTVGNIANTYASWEMGTIDVANGKVHFSFTLPTTFTTLTKAAIRLVHTGPTGRILRYNVETDWGAAGEAYTANTDSIAPTDLTLGDQNDIEDIDISAAFTGVAALDTIGLMFEREAAHANDTASLVYVLGLILEFT